MSELEQTPEPDIRSPRVRTFIKECRLLDRILPAAFLSGTIIALGFFVLFAPPSSFPSPSIFKVKKGETLGEVASGMKIRGMVRSARILTALVRATGGDRQVQEGSYFFPEPQNVFTIAVRLENADFELKPVRVTIVEGADVREIARLLEEKLAPFDTDGFLSLALPKEGYLYPDTYFFYPGQDADIVAGAMEDNFSLWTASVEKDIAASKKTERDIVIMASILEKEARTDVDRRIIAGILWKRMSIGMRLQVDAAFGYIFDKSLTQLTSADLKTDSPYNTYLNKGLPPTPIGNPSVRAIEAAANPTKTNYLFYLSDRYGTMHYAATYAQHLQNVRRYLGS